MSREESLCLCLQAIFTKDYLSDLLKEMGCIYCLNRQQSMTKNE